MRRAKQPQPKVKRKPIVRVQPEVSFADSRDRLEAMAAVGERFASWRPAVEVLTHVRAVPTIFPQLDEITRVGGWPIERFSLVHGPSNEGKTALLHGLGLSFLQRGHFYAYIDAEYTTPAMWITKLMGQFAAHPGFRALRPKSYEQTVDSVRELCGVIGEAKAKGELPTDTSALIVVDSLRKLVPKRLLEKLLKEGSDDEPGGRTDKRKPKPSVDGMGGRAAMYKAALNAAWLDELVPMLAESGAAMIVVARETEDPDADFFSEGIKVGGGKAVNYDSSLVCRVSRIGWVQDGGKDSPVVGERHQVEVRKTKIGYKETRRPRAVFHTSNGVVFPAGFDKPRDLLEQALDHGVIQLSGSWFSMGDERLGHGVEPTLRRLHTDADLLATIEAEVRSKFELDLPTVK